jgi:hypothetical protein
MLNYGATNMVPAQKDENLLYSKRRLELTNKNLVMNPDGAQKNCAGEG